MATRAAHRPYGLCARPMGVRAQGLDAARRPTCFVIAASFVRGAATARPCCRRRARGHRPIRHRDAQGATVPGRMKPPISSPSTSSARLHAAPRAQRTQPCATAGAIRLRARDVPGGCTSPLRPSARAAYIAASRIAGSPRVPRSRSSSGRTGAARSWAGHLDAARQDG